MFGGAIQKGAGMRRVQYLRYRIGGLAVGVMVVMAMSACDGTGRTDPAGGVHSTDGTGSTRQSINVGADERRQEKENMKIRLIIGEKVLDATLADNAAARDFLSLLPISLTLRDYASTEKVSDLPRRLATDGTPAGVDPNVGDITYYAPWGNLAIFYRDFGYAEGLVKLGHLDSGIEVLTSRQGEFEVRIERTQEER